MVVRNDVLATISVISALLIPEITDVLDGRLHTNPSELGVLAMWLQGWPNLHDHSSGQAQGPVLPATSDACVETRSPWAAHVTRVYRLTATPRNYTLQLCIPGDTPSLTLSIPHPHRHTMLRPLPPPPRLSAEPQHDASSSHSVPGARHKRARSMSARLCACGGRLLTSSPLTRPRPLLTRAPAPPAGTTWPRRQRHREAASPLARARRC